MKTFQEWREGVENIPGWEEMPKSQKELIHYHRLSEKYASELSRCSSLIRDILDDLERSLVCRGMAAKYRRTWDDLQAQFIKNQVPSHF